MNNNDKPNIWYFDDFPIIGGAFAEAVNMIVYGRTGAGKTTLLQGVIGRYTDGNSEQGHNGEPVE
ncbi:MULTISPECIES: hypothetical protein [Serratia]|uniref:hypothetical protein n=1 Tax=Serratia TaxID=613 RepID=UPI002A5A5550|nr:MULTISPECIES: hypothetical protein [Serratia]MDY0768543.1 hypothetical protein [Serratia nevei]MED6027192.1 hypothetical protein [Serratia marcescens]